MRSDGLAGPMTGCTRRDALAIAIAGLVAPVPAVARTLTLGGPRALNAHSGAWDSGRRADDRQVLGDLWQFGRSGWSRLSRSGPPARTFAAVAYDARRDRFVLFGGNRVLFGDGGTADTLLGDHGEWDGRRWHQIAGPLPPSRTESATAFDPARNRLILFGGWRWADGARVRLDDLWEFDGRSWTQLEGTRPAAGRARR